MMMTGWPPSLRAARVRCEQKDTVGHSVCRIQTLAARVEQDACAVVVVVEHEDLRGRQRRGQSTVMGCTSAVYVRLYVCMYLSIYLYGYLYASLLVVSCACDASHSLTQRDRPTLTSTQRHPQPRGAALNVLGINTLLSGDG